MKRREAEKLLGGYATGILTEDEKRVLFSAALKDQALFEALLDEEAFRVLLEQPGVRAQLLASLSPQKASMRPLWRRPATLGLAASLLAMVTASVLMLRQTPPVLPTPQPTPEAPAPAESLPQPPSEEGRRTLPPPAPKVPEVAPPELEAAKPVAAPALTPPAPPPAAMTADEAKEMRTEAPAAKKQKAVPVELEAAPKAEASIIPSARAQGGGLAMLAPPTRPTWTLETAAGGKLRVAVTWPQGQHLYLLKRTRIGVAVLTPTEVQGLGGSLLLSRFECSPESEARLDLYLLPSPVADPAKLPEHGPIDGFRERIHPPKK